MDEIYGGCGYIIEDTKDKLNHGVEIETGILEEESKYILKKFFEKCRKRNKGKDC